MEVSGIKLKAIIVVTEYEKAISITKSIIHSTKSTYRQVQQIGMAKENSWSNSFKTRYMQLFFGPVQLNNICRLVQCKFIVGLVQRKFIVGLVQRKFIFLFVNSHHLTTLLKMINKIRIMKIEANEIYFRQMSVEIYQFLWEQRVWKRYYKFFLFSVCFVFFLVVFN